MPKIPNKQEFYRDNNDSAVPQGTNKLGNASTQIYGDGTNLTNIPTAGSADAVTTQALKGTAGTIPAGSVVYITGWNVGLDIPEVELAKADSMSTMPALGVTSTVITNASQGTVVESGAISGLNTSSYSVNDALYVSAATAGALTSTKPTGANFIQKIAEVIRSNGSTGVIGVFGAGRTNDVPNDIDVVNTFNIQSSQSITGITTSVATPGSDNNLVTEAGIRTAIDAGGGGGTGSQTVDSTTIAYTDMNTNNSVSILSLPAKCSLTDVNVVVTTAFDDDTKGFINNIMPSLELSNYGVKKPLFIPYMIDSDSATTLSLINGALATWSAGDTLSGNRAYLGACGTLTAGLSVGGFDSSSGLVTCEEYDGTTWSNGGDLNTATYDNAVFGSQTSCVCGAGTGFSNTTEEYNGTAWSNGNNCNTARSSPAGGGVLNAGIMTAGLTGAGAYTAVSEEYNGTNWNVGVSCSTARGRIDGCGLINSFLIVGGYTGSDSDIVESFDGISWTTESSLPSANSFQGVSGTRYEAFSTGGNYSTGTSATDIWNGYSWSTGSTLSQSRTNNASGGSVNAGFTCGGFYSGSNFINSTEELATPNWSGLTQGSLTVYYTYSDYS